MKLCTRCDTEKSRDKFGKNSAKEDGLQSYCAECIKEYLKNRGRTKPEGWERKTADMSAYQRGYRERNREELREKRKVWLKEHPEYEKAKYKKRSERKLTLRKEDRGFGIGIKLTEEEVKHHAKAKQIVRSALRNGILEKLPCFVCGEGNVEGHHPDYDSPLDVVWLCRKHHMQLHREHNKLVNG